MAYQEVDSSELLFKGSIDGFTAKAFHQLCDNKGPTIALIRDTKGNIFGGFTSLFYNSSCEFVRDPNAFLFSLTKKSKHPVKSNSYRSIFMNEEYLMIFGCGDLVISDLCNVNQDEKKQSFSRFGQEYDFGSENPNPPNNPEDILTYLTGGFNFVVDEIEVFKINFQQNHNSPMKG